MAADGHRLTTILDAALAKQRPAAIGLASLDALPARPVYNNDEAVEQTRREAYAALEAQYAAAAAAWNAEAHRWHAARADVAAELIRETAYRIVHSSRGSPTPDDETKEQPPATNEGGAALIIDHDEDHDEEEQRGQARAQVARSLEALQLSEMVADESGLAASSVLVELAERQIDLDAVLATVRERARWLCGVADQQRAVASVCAEQRAAFIARWQQRAAAFEAEPLESPQGEQPHFDDEFSSSQQQAHAQGQARREDEADQDVDGSALYAMWLG